MDGERGGMEGRHQRAGGGEERTILAWIRTSSTAKKNNIIIKLQTILPYFNMFSFFLLVLKCNGKSPLLINVSCVNSLYALLRHLKCRGSRKVWFHKCKLI